MKQPHAKSFGALPSLVDPRTVKHSDLVSAGVPLIKGGITYSPSDIENQHTVGICTAISLVQNRQKLNGKKYSSDFQYLLQKNFYDLNWSEGSSILNALKVGTKYGFLPTNLWTFTTEADRQLPYATYIAKLSAITSDQINALIAQCVDKLAGYASINVSDPQAIALAVNTSGVGILCRYVAGSSWWTGTNGIASWQPKDIDPIRYPIPAPDAHAIGVSEFNFTSSTMFGLPNTWGTDWDLQGNCHINWDNYKMTEAWVILNVAPPLPPVVYPVLRLGSTGTFVKLLQNLLNKKISAGLTIDGQFGSATRQAVYNFQKLNGLSVDGAVGNLTWAKLNL